MSFVQSANKFSGILRVFLRSLPVQSASCLPRFSSDAAVVGWGAEVWGFVLLKLGVRWLFPALVGFQLLWSQCPNPVSLDEISPIIPANLGVVSCRCRGMRSAWLSTALSKTDPHLVLETGMGKLSPKNEP